MEDIQQEIIKLHGQIVVKDALIQRKDSLIQQKDEEIVELLAKNKKLAFDFESLIKSFNALKKGEFRKKSEKLNIVSNQFALFEMPEPEVQEKVEAITVPSHTRAKKKAKNIDELPVVEEVVKPEIQECECCKKDLVRIGQEESKTLEYEPSKLYVKKTIREKFACKHCKESPIQIAPCQSLIPGAAASVSIVTQILISKFCDHLPLHRQERMFERLGYLLERKTMSEWLQHVAENHLERIAEAIKALLLKEDYLHGDETPLDVQDRTIPGNMHSGYLWGMLGKAGVYFEYSPSRSQDSAKSIFGNYAGYLQTDLYAGYNSLSCKRLACMAHIRRKFVDAQNCKERDEILNLIAKLYHEEEESRKKKEDFLLHRQTKSKDTLTKLHQYLQYTKDNYTPQSDIVKAVDYALKQWDDVLRLLEKKEFKLDNNAIERQIRPIAIGKKNWLFAGSHRGAKNAATIFTILNSCSLASVNPTAYLHDVLSIVLDFPVNKISDLTPLNWKLAISTK